MTTIDGNELRFEFAALPERVWEAMTNPTKAAAWLPNGPVSEVGRMFTFPDSRSGEKIAGVVIAVDPPSRIALRWRRPARAGVAAAEGAMTWVVAPAPGGAAVRVIVSAVDDPTAGADLAVALRTLFDERLRTVLRGRAPARASRPAEAPSPERPSSPHPVLIDVASAAGATPAGALGVRAGMGEAVVEGGSQAVSVWPALRRGKSRPSEQEPRRRTGTALGLRLVAVIVVAAALGAISFGAPSIPWAAPPDESTIPDDTATTAGSLSSGGFDPTAQVGGGVASAGTGSSSGNPAVTATTTGPPLLPPLTVSVVVTDRLLGLLDVLVGYTVKVTITNPAGVAQPWQDLTVHIDGVSLLINVVDSVVNLVLGGNDPCFAPATPTSIGAGQTLQFSYKVTGVGLGQPTLAQLNAAVCD